MSEEHKGLDQQMIKLILGIHVLVKYLCSGFKNIPGV